MSLSALLLLTLLQGSSLPPFEVKNLDGSVVTSAELARDGRWLLIYVQTHCRPCDALLDLLRKEDLPQPKWVKVIVAGSPDDARALAQKFPGLASASWYVDPGRKAFETLKLPGAPIVWGMQGEQIGWRLAGVLPKTSDVRAILLSWIEVR